MFRSFFMAMMVSSTALAGIDIERGRRATVKLMQETGTVSILFQDDGAVYAGCTGVRVAADVIMTAGHCFDNSKQFPVGIRQSINPLDDSVAIEKIEGIIMPFKDYYFHTQFKISHWEDIAFVKLAEESDASFMELGKVSTSGAFLQLGYGREDHGDDSDNHWLHYLDQGKWIGYRQSMGPAFFSIKNPGSSVRPGDSGGPLIQGGRVVGILSSCDPAPLSEIKNGRADYAPALRYVEWARQFLGEEFQDQLGSLPTQYEETETVWMTKSNKRSLHKQLCSELDVRFGSRWELDPATDKCLPRSKRLCEQLGLGEIENTPMEVIWDETKRRCVPSERTARN